MHVFGHHDDLFSWKKYNNYIHANTLQVQMCTMLLEGGNKLFQQKIQRAHSIGCRTLLCHA
jgi:hypothetical protein